jgi:hypothetical protein
MLYHWRSAWQRIFKRFILKYTRWSLNHFKSSSAELWRRVVFWLDTDVSEVHAASIVRIKWPVISQIQSYEGVTKSFRTGCLERELKVVQLSATRCSCIAFFVSQSSEFCGHDPFVLLLNEFLLLSFRYRLSLETFGYTLVQLLTFSQSVSYSVRLGFEPLFWDSWPCVCYIKDFWFCLLWGILPNWWTCLSCNGSNYFSVPGM